MIAIVTKLMGLLSSRERLQLQGLFLALVCMAGIEMAGIASIMPFMAVVARPEVVHDNRWLKGAYELLNPGSLQDFLFLLGMLVLALMVFSNAFKALTSWLLLKYDNRLNYVLARRLLAKYLARPYAYFLDRNTADMGKNVLAEVRTVIAGVLSPGMKVISSALVSFFILVLLVAVDPAVAVTIAVVLGGAYGLIYLTARRRLARLGQGQVHANSMKYKAAGEALSGIKDLKILGREMVFLERFALHAQRHAQGNATAGVIAQLPRYALETIAFGGILLIVLYFLGSQQDMSQMVPLLALYAFAGYRLLPALQQIFAGITNVRFNLAALDVLHRDLVATRDEGDAEKRLQSTRLLEPLAFSRALELERVSFVYPGASVPAVSDLSLTISSRSSVGFVGATGSGRRWWSCPIR